MELAIKVSQEDGGVILLRLDGALDLASRDHLLDAGAAALAETTTKRLTIEMAEVTFFDSSGIGAIVRLAGEAEDSGREFSLRAPSSRVSRVLSIAGIADAWTIED